MATFNRNVASGGDMTYETTQSRSQKHRAKKRVLAIQKIASGSEPSCAICGCPHAEILHIGHPEHRGGRWHRRELTGRNKDSRGIVLWVLRTPIEEVLERVQLECPYCNAWHNRFKEYPPEEKQPKW